MSDLTRTISPPGGIAAFQDVTGLAEPRFIRQTLLLRPMQKLQAKVRQ